MTKTNRMVIGVAVLAASVAGFALARFTERTVGPANIALDEHPGETEGHDDDVARENEQSEGVVVLTPRQIEASGINVVAVGRGGGREFRLTGRVEPAVDARAAVPAIVGGRVERVLVAPGSAVRAGQPLAVLVSGEAASLRAAADAASAEEEAARLLYERDLSLVEQGVVARQELETSRARFLAVQATARAAHARVAAAGSPDTDGRVSVVSPMNGIVGIVQVTPGGFVTAGGIVVDVLDPSRTELVFTVPPALVAQVSAGTRVEVTGPSGSFEAEVLGVVADAHEQSGAAVIRARAISGALPPAGSAVAGTVVTDSQDGLAVPADALQTVDGQAVVFVAMNGGFRATPVLAGRRAGGRIEILKGLSGGERIASTNAFLLKAELATGEAEQDH